MVVPAPTRWVIASGNAGKLREFAALLDGSGIEGVPQHAFGIEDVDETGLTFVENALLKARHAARRSGLPALADDSGLCVDALGGAPGLYSARYAGAHGDSAANIARLLDALAGVASPKRTACFHATVVLLRHADDPRPLVAEGEWTGCIASRACGDGGFGYDPVFFDPAHAQTAAQMHPDLRNRVSHRAQALARLRARLDAA